MAGVGVLGVSMALRRERPDLIVAELVARDLTLRDLFRRLSADETTRCIPVLVVTSSCDTPAIDTATRDGAVTVLRSTVRSRSFTPG